MKRFAYLLSTVLISTAALADEKVIEKNLGGSEQVRLESSFELPVVKGFQYSSKDLANITAKYKANKGYIYDDLGIQMSKESLEDVLHAAGLPQIETSKEVTTTIIVEKDRCQVKNTKKTMSFDLEASDVDFLRDLGGKCKRAIGKPEKLAKLRAKGECLPLNFSSVSKLSKLVNLKPLNEATLIDEVRPNTPAANCKSNVAVDPGFQDAQACSNDLQSYSCLNVTKKSAPTLKDGKWVYSVALLQDSSIQAVLPNITRNESRTVTTKLTSIGFSFTNMLYNSSATFYENQGKWEASASLSDVLSNKNYYHGLNLSAVYETEGREEILKAKYDEELGKQSISLENLMMNVDLKRKNISKIQYYIEHVQFNETNFNKACGMNWDYNSTNTAQVFPIFCAGDTYQMSLKYRVRLYFKDQNNTTRYVTMMTDSALEGFTFSGSSMTIPGAGLTNKNEAQKFMNSQYADQLLEALMDADSADSAATFSFPLKDQNLKIGVKGDNDDVYLGLSSAVKSWSPNAKTWNLK